VKILFMNTFSTVHGGAERLLFDTSTELIARGHDVSMVIARDDRRSKNPEFWPSRINRYYVPELVLPFTDRYTYTEMRRTDQYQDAKRYLQDILNIESPDLIHVHNFPCIEVLGDLEVGAPMVRTIHSYENQCENHLKRLPNGSICTHPLGDACRDLCGYEKSFKAVRVRAENSFMKKRFSRLLAISSYVKEVLITNGFPGEKISVLPNFTRLNYKPIDVVEEDVVLYVGRLTPEKGLLELIDSLKLAKTKTKLLIVGKDGALGQSDFQEKVMRRAADAGIDIEVEGWLVGDKLRLAYARAKVIAFSSVWPEPFGLVGIEAMSQGKPVVAFDCGGVRQWLEHERTGYVVPHGDIEEYACRIDQLMGDDVLRAEMGARARAAAQNRFSPDAYIRSLLGIYTEVLNESSPYRSGGRTEIRDPQRGISVPV
jgi:glycosyltransferase involved in cell wall biosynthesis